MTSTSIHVGLPEKDKRVTHRREHAHADIFGASETKAATKPEPKTEQKEVVQKESVTSPQKPAPESASNDVRPSTRVRMPPGGASSGLW